jgi:hypothetical protein
MLCPPWLVVPIVFFAILFVLFTAFTMWLSHTLEGYPMFLIQNQDRDTGVVPHSLRLRSLSESPPVLSAFPDNSEVRSRNRHNEAIGHHTERL